MYFWIFVFIFTIVFGIFLFPLRDNTKNFPIINVVGSSLLLGIIVGGISFMLVSFIVTETMDRVIVKTSSYELKALNTDRELEGNVSMMFFVGSGYIGEQQYYYIYKKYRNGNIQFEKYRSEEVYLNENSNVPKIVTYGKRFKNLDSGWILGSQRFPTYHSTVIYIPKGTIKTNFKVN